MNCKYCQNESCVMAGIPNEVPSKCPDAVATNADRIRQMSDEELAHFMARVCPPGGKCNEDGNCFSCRLDWLKSPVEVQDG